MTKPRARDGSRAETKRLFHGASALRMPTLTDDLRARLDGFAVRTAVRAVLGRHAIAAGMLTAFGISHGLDPFGSVRLSRVKPRSLYPTQNAGSRK